jgi:hypothetical protein
LTPLLTPLLTPQSQLGKLTKKAEELEEDSPEEEELDWWSKYYASLDELERQVGSPNPYNLNPYNT